MILYRTVRALVVALCRLLFRERVEGIEHVPHDRPFVLAPVHRSFLDFAFVACLTPRRLRYMGKDSLWKFRLWGKLLSALGAFPIHRGTADREALRRSIEVIKEGEPLVLFPEGTRQSGPAVSYLFEGAAYVSARTGAPILPVGIGGSERALPKGKKLPRPVRVHLVVGHPIEPPGSLSSSSGRVPRRVVHELTNELHVELQQLFDEAQRRAGAA